MSYVPAGVLAGMITVPSVSIEAPVSPSKSSIAIAISPSSTATPLSVSFSVTSPAFPPVNPLTGVALKSSSLARSAAGFTTTVAVAVSQFPGFKFSQI